LLSDFDKFIESQDVYIFLPINEKIKIIKGNITKKEIFNLFNSAIFDIKNAINFWRRPSISNAFLACVSLFLYKTKDLEKFPKEFQKRVKKSFLYPLLKKHDKENKDD